MVVRPPSLILPASSLARFLLCPPICGGALPLIRWVFHILEAVIHCPASHIYIVSLEHSTELWTPKSSAPLGSSTTASHNCLKPKEAESDLNISSLALLICSISVFTCSFYVLSLYISIIGAKIHITYHLPFYHGLVSAF